MTTDGIFTRLKLADTHGDLYRNIVSLRVSENLFDDLSDRPEDWQAAIKTLEELSRKLESYKDVTQLLANARKQKRLGELYTEAAALSESQKWQAVHFSGATTRGWSSSASMARTFGGQNSTQMWQPLHHLA